MNSNSDRMEKTRAVMELYPRARLPVKRPMEIFSRTASIMKGADGKRAQEGVRGKVEFFDLDIFSTQVRFQFLFY